MLDFARKHASLGLRIAVVAAIAGWLLRGDGAATVAKAVAGLPVVALLGAITLGFVASAVAGWRWRWLMHAFGAEPLPRTPTLVRLYLVGFFYNTFVPGSVGGDVVRGVVSRAHFDHKLASYAVVVLERVLGLSALGAVFMVALLAAWLSGGSTAVDVAAYLPWVGGLLALGVLALIAARLSGRLAGWVALIPPVEKWSGVAIAAGLSVLVHLILLGAYFTLAGGLSLPLSVLDLAVVMPICLVASALPIAVASLGPREAATVALLGPLGVDPAQALALSLGYWLVVVAMAAVGGLLQLVGGTAATAT